MSFLGPDAHVWEPGSMVEQAERAYTKGDENLLPYTCEIFQTPLYIIVRTGSGFGLLHLL